MTDVDKGWAWVVLLASFLIHLMTYGLAWSTGRFILRFIFSSLKVRSCP